MARATRAKPTAPAEPAAPYLITVVGADVVRFDVFSQVTTPHFIAHVWTSDEVLDLAKKLTSAALNARSKGKK